MKTATVIFGAWSFSSLLDTITIWVTGQSSSIFFQVIDNLTLTFLLGLFAFASIKKVEK